MDSFVCARLLVNCEAEEKAVLPHFYGGTLRGAFGWALKRTVCPTGKSECRQCLLKEQCIYAYTFETPMPEDTEILRKYHSAPHPFVMTPLLTHKTEFNPGEKMTFLFTLTGRRAVDYMPYYVYAFVKMTANGLGKDRARFAVRKIDMLDKNGRTADTIYENEQLKPVSAFLNFSDALHSARKFNSHAMKVHFITPLRMKYKQKLCDNPQFHIIIRNLLRRLSTMLYFHCGQRLELDFKQIIKNAESIEMINDKAAWYDWKRFSGRQKDYMKMGGIIGSAVYKGELKEFIPYLIAGSWINIGKGTAFGLGSYAVTSHNNGD